jgi:hypothetical protein
MQAQEAKFLSFIFFFTNQLVAGSFACTIDEESFDQLERIALQFDSSSTSQHNKREERRPNVKVTIKEGAAVYTSL